MGMKIQDLTLSLWNEKTIFWILDREYILQLYVENKGNNNTVDLFLYEGGDQCRIGANYWWLHFSQTNQLAKSHNSKAFWHMLDIGPCSMDGSNIIYI